MVQRYELLKLADETNRARFDENFRKPTGLRISGQIIKTPFRASNANSLIYAWRTTAYA